MYEIPFTEDARTSALHGAQAGQLTFPYGALMRVRLIDAIATTARRAREEAGLKQSRIAAALDADQSTIARFERGNWPRDVEVTLRAYDEELGISAGELLRESIELWESQNGNHNNNRR